MATGKKSQIQQKKFKILTKEKINVTYSSAKKFIIFLNWLHHIILLLIIITLTVWMT